MKYPYRWAWRKWPASSWDEAGSRKGEPCRVLVRGSRNSALVQFEDGARVVTSRWGLRRRDG